MKYYEVQDEEGIMHKVYHYAISLISLQGIRNKGDLIPIITNLRSKRIKYIDKNNVVRSTDYKTSFKILDIKEVSSCLKKKKIV